MAERHPIVALLRSEGRTIAWLARETGYRREYLSRVLYGHNPAVVRLRRACAEALKREEVDLFHAERERDLVPA